MIQSNKKTGITGWRISGIRGERVGSLGRVGESEGGRCSSRSGGYRTIDRWWWWWWWCREKKTVKVRERESEREREEDERRDRSAETRLYRK